MLRQTDNCDGSGQLILPLGASAHPPMWRPIHYLGSKLRLAGSIGRCLSELDPSSGTVCDLFSGSGTVALALSGERNVVAADVQEYSRVLCKALLQPGVLDDALVQNLFAQIEHHRGRLEACLEPVLNLEQRALETAIARPMLLCELAEQGSLLAPQTDNGEVASALRETNARIDKRAARLTATTYFGGLYFSYRQTLYIDCVLHAIDQLPADARDTCLAALLSTASTVVNSVGKQFAQPMRPRRKDGTVKSHLIRQMCRDRCVDTAAVFTGWLSRYRQLPRMEGHRVIRGDYREVLRELTDVSVVYADPPYTRDHYSRFYHVLETLSLGDRPRVTTTLLAGRGATSRGVYRADRHQSPFCIKSQAPTAFRELFEGCKRLGVPLLLSYSPFVKDGHPRLMAVEAISEIAREYYGHVHVVPAGDVVHSKLNKASLHLDASRDAEMFIMCRC